jgi:hypothetical protein
MSHRNSPSTPQSVNNSFYWCEEQLMTYILTRKFRVKQLVVQKCKSWTASRTARRKHIKVLTCGKPVKSEHVLTKHAVWLLVNLNGHSGLKVVDVDCACLHYE